MTNPRTTRPGGDDDDVVVHESNNNNEFRLLGTLPLAVLVFYSVSGGPFGIEASVRSAGPLFSLLGFAIMPFVWSLPEAMITTELSTAYPEASGGVAWVEEAFGSFWGWMSGYLNWISGATDNAIYPVLFMDYLLQIVNDKESPENESKHVVRFLFLSCISIGLAYINWRGLTLVGNVSIGICLLSLSPFIPFCILGAFEIKPSRWLQLPIVEQDTTFLQHWENNNTAAAAASLYNDDDDNMLTSLTNQTTTTDIIGTVLWRPFLNNLFWNLNSFDSAASFAGDIRDPGRVFPKAMFWAVVMVAFAYLTPLLVALGASDDVPQHAWVDGYLASVASQIVGPWLGVWVVFAAAISNIALFQAELSSDAYQLMGMAHRGFLPKILGNRSRYGTPTYPIMIGTIVIVVMGISNLDELIEMLNFNYSLALLLEYAAFIKLRISKGEVRRPYRIPIESIWGCVLLITPAVFFTLAVIFLASSATFIYSFFVNVLGILIFEREQLRVFLCYCGWINDDADDDSCSNNNSTSGADSNDSGGDDDNDREQKGLLGNVLAMPSRFDVKPRPEKCA